MHGAPAIKLLGHYVPVRARIESLDGMSVHADEGELLTWLRDGEGVPDVVYIIHGDEAARSTLADRGVRDLGRLTVLRRRGDRPRRLSVVARGAVGAPLRPV